MNYAVFCTNISNNNFCIINKYFSIFYTYFSFFAICHIYFLSI